MCREMGTFIRERRQHLGLSQEELANRVGGAYSQSDISRLERGHIGLPRLSTIVRLATSLEVSIGDLLIAGGWFDDTHLTRVHDLSGGSEAGRFDMVFVHIESELATIRDPERQAATRSRQLRDRIRTLKASSEQSGSLMVAD